MEGPIQYLWKIGFKKAGAIAGAAAVTFLATLLASTRTVEAIAWLRTIGVNVTIQVEDPNRLGSWIAGTVVTLGLGILELARNRKKVLKQIAEKEESAAVGG